MLRYDNMSEHGRPMVLHSLAEACLYVRVTPCKLCAGPLDWDDAKFEHDIAHNLLALKATCRTCGETYQAQFDSAEVLPAEWSSLQNGKITNPWECASPEINPSDEPSRVIDLGGWLTLFTLMADMGRADSNRIVGRQHRLVAIACLEEALKFFDEDNDLPPEDAFFHDDTRRPFWERPELFTRQHIAELRFSLMRSPSG